MRITGLKVDVANTGASGTMRRKKGVIGFFVHHRVAANLVMLVMLLGGVLALTRMNIQFFPDLRSRRGQRSRGVEWRFR